MTQRQHVLLLGLMAALLAGCMTTGLSLHEAIPGSGRAGGFAQTLYAFVPATDATPPGPVILKRPLTLAVVQLGEVAPPQRMVAQLQAHPDLIRRVEVLPSLAESPTGTAKRSSTMDTPPDATQTPLAAMRRLAEQLGLDYLFLFGGSVDYGAHQTPATVLDWTILGAYLVPTQAFAAYGRATGVLLDVHTGQLLCTVTSDAEVRRALTTMQTEQSLQPYLTPLREALIEHLTDQLVTRLAQMPAT